MSTLVFFLYLLEVLAWAGLLALDLRHGRRHGTEVPRGFEGQLDLETLRRISAYTRESTAFSLLALAAWNACLLGFLFGGGIEAYDRWIDSLGLDAAQGRFLFFFVLLAGLHTFGVVAGLIETFRIEAKYGFARSGIGAWLRDQAVRRIRSAILWALCGTATAAFLDNLPPQPWIWALALPLPSYLAWAFLLPLWLHWTERGFQRLANPELEAPVRALVEKAGFRVSGVYTWKASRWTGHTNAWFAGIGRTRRVVLFDTLIASMGIAEILAVTAHELGHWRRRAVWKSVLAASVLVALGLLLAVEVFHEGWVPSMIGLEDASSRVQVVILWFVWKIPAFLSMPLLSSLSRREELGADRCAAEATGDPAAVARALVRLALVNLANLHPHPLMVWFCHTHPPYLERVQAVLALGAAESHPATGEPGRPADPGSRPSTA